jgi:hypothetical protein
MQVERLERKLANPVNQRTGKPLTECTIRSYRDVIMRYRHQIAEWEIEINRLSKSPDDYDDD